MDFYKRALELSEELKANRRHIHKNPEVGLHLPKTCAFVLEKLAEYGIEGKPCGEGVTATIGKGGKVLLLRADMDALPMPEESGEAFACTTGTEAHACGHDTHTAMLLTAAKLLKEQEDKLSGTVKLMFQPAEETFQGAQNMLDAGILQNPAPDAALAIHSAPGRHLPGEFYYNSKTTMMASVDGFRIEITGKGGHGSGPHNTIDPIHIAVQVFQGLEGLVAREADPRKLCVLTVGKFQAGNANNVIPSVALLEGTLRTDEPGIRAQMVRRIKEVAEGITAACGGTVKVEFPAQTPPLVCNPQVTDDMARYFSELPGANMKGYSGSESNGSEDFAAIAEKVPSAFFFVTCGFDDDRKNYGTHNPKVCFNEEYLPMGAAGLAECAYRWLEEHK